MFSKLFIDWLSHEEPPSGMPICDFERIRYEIRPCDVLLIEGRSRISEAIKQITQSAWSHAALYIGRLHDIEDVKLREKVAKYYKDTPDAQLLIEGVIGHGTIINPLSIYIKDHIRICRPRGLSPSDGQKVISYAIGRLGTDYDIRQIFDIARFMLPWGIMPRRWRSSLFETHAGLTTRTVCSTMIAEAFNAVEFPILPLVKPHETTGVELIRRNPKLMVPRDFDHSPYFEIIKYPFIDADQALYRRLPWNREGLMSNDDTVVTHHMPTFSENGHQLKTKDGETIELHKEDDLETNTLEKTQPSETENDEKNTEAESQDDEKNTTYQEMTLNAKNETPAPNSDSGKLVQLNKPLGNQNDQDEKSEEEDSEPESKSFFSFTLGKKSKEPEPEKENLKSPGENNINETGLKTDEQNEKTANHDD